MGKTGIEFSKHEATTPSSIWDPKSCSIKIPIQALRKLRLRWAQRGWMRRESQTLLTRQRSEDSALAASATGSYKSSQALIKPWTGKPNTQSAAGLLHWGLQTPFQSCFGLPQLLQGLVCSSSKAKSPLNQWGWKAKDFFSTCSESLMKIMRDRHCLNEWTPYRHQCKYIFWNGISATCPTNTQIQSMAICKGCDKTFLELFFDGPGRHEIPHPTGENIPMDTQTIKWYYLFCPLLRAQKERKKENNNNKSPQEAFLANDSCLSFLICTSGCGIQWTEISQPTEICLQDPRTSIPEIKFLKADPAFCVCLLSHCWRIWVQCKFL